MIVVIDSNVLFSALIKDSITRKIILDYDGFFLFPSYVFIELQAHKRELLKKSGMSPRDFDGLLQLILKKVMIIPNETLVPYKKEAYDTVREIDADDTIFVACALAYPNSILWSNDKGLKKQAKVRVLNTEEFIELTQSNL